MAEILNALPGVSQKAVPSVILWLKEEQVSCCGHPIYLTQHLTAAGISCNGVDERKQLSKDATCHGYLQPKKAEEANSLYGKRSPDGWCRCNACIGQSRISNEAGATFFTCRIFPQIFRFYGVSLSCRLGRSRARKSALRMAVRSDETIWSNLMRGTCQWRLECIM